ncbi:MAG TPA: hypothetical protein VEX64_08375, partial [Pyrinomonadaceae bacterium]|nr:hypothetical protein [Pyrinomonadaceae bacterium]
SQTVVDKMLVSVSDNVRADLITYSDLLWQLALQPGSPLEAPRKEDLNQILQILIEQRLIALEAERLPTTAPTEAEVAAEIRRIVLQFPSAAAFETRLRLVGFDSTDDPNFRRIIEQRVAIEKYLDFRFRSFVVVTPEDEQKFYEGTFAARFRQANPGVVLPPIEQVQRRINEELTEIKIAADIDSFLEQARARAVVTILNPL